MGGKATATQMTDTDSCVLNTPPPPLRSRCGTELVYAAVQQA